MGIKSTRFITRDAAIDRIREITYMVTHKRFRDLEEISSESGINIEKFVNDGVSFDIKNILQWTDNMLSNQMDIPFYRHSMFNNYYIGVEDD